MDSKPFVSLFGAQATPAPAEASRQQQQSPLKVSPSNSSGSLPIRAPPTSDSDTEPIITNKGHKKGSSSDITDGDYESDGFLSGEEEFETASERPYFADPDEETLDFATEGKVIGVPFVSNIDMEDEIIPVVEPVLGSSIFSSSKTVRPIAQLSGVDDDDENVVVADEGLISGVEEEVEALKVRVLEGDGEEKESHGDGDSTPGEVLGLGVRERDVFHDSLGVSAESSEMTKEEIHKPDNGVSGYEEKEPSVQRNSLGNPVSDELVQNRVGVVTESPAEEKVATGQETLPENMKLEADVSHAAVHEIPAIKTAELEATMSEDKFEEEKNEVLGGDHTVRGNSAAEGDFVVDDKESIEMAEESSILGSGTDQATSVMENPAEPILADADGGNSVSGGDSVLEAKNPSLSSLESEVGNALEKGVSETEGVEVEKSVSLDNGSVLESPYVEEPNELEIIETDSGVGKIEDEDSVDVDHKNSDRDPEAVTHSVIEAQELGSRELNPIVPVGEKDDNPDAVSASIDSLVDVCEDSQKDGNNGGAADGGVYLSEDKDPSRPELENKSIELDSAQEAKSQLIVAEESKKSENGDACGNAQSGGPEGGLSSKLEESKSMVRSLIVDSEAKQEADNEENPEPYEEEDEEDDDDDDETMSDEDAEGLIFGSSETTKQIMKELEQGSASHSGAESFQDHSQIIEGQIVTDSDEEVDTDGEGDGKELFDSSALAALLKAATNAGTDAGSITISSPDGSRLFSVERPAGLGSSIRPLRPAPRPSRPNLFAPSDLTAGGESENNLSEEEKKKLEKIQLLRVKFLRLVQRLGHSPEDSIASQVLYRLVLVAGRQTSQAFSLESAKRTAMQLEAEGKDDLDFSLNILVLGKTGVGKSATINSIFGEEKSLMNAFEPATSSVKEIIGVIDGVKIRFLDTPGLRPSAMEQSFNRKVLSSIKKFTKKFPPDIVLYVDRLDTQTRDLNDLPLLRSITNTLGAPIWRSTIVTLTHGASAPPEGPTGSPLSYDVFVAQRSHVVQQCIGQAVGDMRLMNPSLMNPVSLVENHPSCRKNREGQRILPNGQSWRPQLLLLGYSMKILSEASSLSKPQDPYDHRKLFGFRVRSPPLPYLLSSLLQSRAHPKLSSDQGGDNGDSDVDLVDLSDSDREEEEDEYDQLPPFKPLRKAQVVKLSKEQKKAYFDEYDYRVKLLQKKQWREELKRMKEMKKKGKDSQDDYGYMGEDVDQEDGVPAAVPVPLPDMVLPPSFDGDNPAYRYRFLEPTSQLLARPVLDTHGWDHDSGYDGVSLEENLAIAGRFPAGFAIQVTKDKKEFNIHLDSSVSAKHGDNGSTLAGFDIQTIGKQLAYILRGEAKFKNFKKNKTAAGVSVTFLGENVATGLKVEDQIAIGKRLVFAGSTGAVRSQGDVAYGANLEVRLKDKDYPINQDQSTLGLSLMKWRGDLALGANLQSQFSIGRSSKMAVRVGLNNKLSGQITVRTSSSEQLHIALLGVLPLAIAIFKSIWPAGETYSAY
ncbi:translocase of chloroplast 159, chloroplastic-like [Macadamia integrifolia]|uniref:translocase of chloroplast 159, chloroplastic-like n=1 Tax=Macadamia integrifolia TaxID=60698 RepID=UPI001C4F9F60|nr:translocase of chloroplast 159, chloroplastic-like [Macadamia integrifolia]